MKNFGLPLAMVILSMLPAVLLFAQQGGGTTDKQAEWIKARKSSNSNSHGQQKLERTRNGTKGTVKGTGKKTTANPTPAAGTGRKGLHSTASEKHY